MYYYASAEDYQLI